VCGQSFESCRRCEYCDPLGSFIRTSGLPFRICFHSSSLTVRYQVQCRPNQNIVSATVARETFYSSPPYPYHHTHRMSRRLSQFFKGKFQVVPVPANHHDISIKFSRQNVLPIIFPPGNQAKTDVQSRVYDGLLERLKVTMDDEGLVLKKGTMPQLSMNVNVHATRVPSPTPRH